MANTTLYFVGGNVGAGKTALLSVLAQSDFLNSTVVLCEQPKIWSDTLNIFYKALSEDTSVSVPSNSLVGDEGFVVSETELGTAFYNMQKSVATHWSKLLLKIKTLLSQGTPPKRIMVERSPLESLQVFIKANRHILTKAQFLELNSTYVQLYEDYKQLAHCRYFNLDVDPTACLGRIQRRNTAWDQDVSLQYLRLLDGYYQQFFQNYKQADRIDFCVIDGDGFSINRMISNFLVWVGLGR